MGALLRGGIVAGLAVAAVAQAGKAEPPALRIETPGRHAELEGRLRQLDTSHLLTIARLVGLDATGPPIHVVLADERSDVARATPSWIAGFARGPSNTIVLFPARSPRYPHDTLEAVLYHEVAHILIHRASRGVMLPRWFDEGLATVAERAWTFEDRRQLAWALASGMPQTLDDLDRAFDHGSGQAARAYALSGAFVRNIIDRHGLDAPARILELTARDVPFDEAFTRATGEPLREAEQVFQARIMTWERWIPLATSPFVLWTATTVLALYAISVARWRRAKRRARWDEHEEEENDSGAGETGNEGPTVVE